MKQFLFAASALALSLGFPAALPSPAVAASSAECQAIFDRGDVHREGWIDGDETQAYLNVMKEAGMIPAGADHGGRLTPAMFQAACERGIFQGLQQPHSRPRGPSYGGSGW
jgi:hypothetical protein